MCQTKRSILCILLVAASRVALRLLRDDNMRYTFADLQRGYLTDCYYSEMGIIAKNILRNSYETYFLVNNIFLSQIIPH